MGISVGKVIARADVAMDEFGHAPSTRMQYRWAWSRFDTFCRARDVVVFSDEMAVLFLDFVTDEFRAGRFKQWKYKLLRKAVLVLREVAATGFNNVVGGSDRGDQRRVGPEGPAGSAAVRNMAEGPIVGSCNGGSVCDNLAGGIGLAAPARRGRRAETLRRGRVRGGGIPRQQLPAGQHAHRADRVAGVVPLHRNRRWTLGALAGGAVACGQDDSTSGGADGRRRGPVAGHTGYGHTNWPGDRAIRLLVARTGLRPSDIAGLRLGDIDWRAGRITVTQHKTGVLVTLPLLADVGAAIAGYLLDGRPMPAVIACSSAFRPRTSHWPRRICITWRRARSPAAVSPRTAARATECAYCAHHWRPGCSKLTRRCR